jgi:DNA mismatch repair protein MutL
MPVVATTPRIAVLPEHVRNRIAAGEVVERPASVIRELVDNSLDAGAKAVDIVIENGGARLIRVADDGCGMAADDLPLAVQRYATSKITDSDQIFGIKTLGFRGEALPSIGAVSETSITSRTRDSSAAARITIKAGESDGPRPAAGACGTVVEVRNLFFNTPARRKFMKSARSESGAAAEVVTETALARPDVAFRMTVDDSPLIDLPPSVDFRGRARGLFGPELAEAFIEGAGASEDGLAARVWLAPPALHRANRKGIHLFVDGRPVRDASLVQAVLEGYRGLVMTRQYPQAFVFIDCPSGAVDVNVHPQKAEVRFRERDSVFGLVVRTIRTALAKSDLAPRVEAQPSVASGQGSVEEQIKIAPAMRFPLSISEPALAELESKRSALRPSPFSSSLAPGPLPLVPALAPSPRVPLSAVPAPHSLGARRDALGDFRYLGQLAATYLLIESSDGLRIVDPHALHERILFDQLMAARGQRFGDVQRLLVPESVDLSPAEAIVLETLHDDLTAMGYEIDAFGPASAAVRAVPSALARARLGDVLRELADRLDSGAALDQNRLRESAFARVACRAAVKFGDLIPDPEARALLQKWRDGLGLDSCPHGRPTSIVITAGELERMFGRRR